MRVPLWHDKRQMFAEVSPWEDWGFAVSIAPVAARFISAGHGGGKSKQHGRYPRNTPTPDALIDERVGGYSSNPQSIGVARYHRIFEWVLELGTLMLTAGRTSIKRQLPTPVCPAYVMVATAQWFRTRNNRDPAQDDLGLNGMPPTYLIDEEFGSVEGLVFAMKAVAGP